MEDDIDVLWKDVNCINCEHVELNLKKKFLCFVFMISCMKFMWMNQDWLCAHAYNVALELLELPHITIPKAFEIAFKLQVLNFLCQSSVGSVRLYFSYGEAIAWLSVCAFSPLATGAILKLARVE